MKFGCQCQLKYIVASICHKPRILSTGTYFSLKLVDKMDAYNHGMLIIMGCLYSWGAYIHGVLTNTCNIMVVCSIQYAYVEFPFLLIPECATFVTF